MRASAPYAAEPGTLGQALHPLAAAALERNAHPHPHVRVVPTVAGVLPSPGFSGADANHVALASNPTPLATNPTARHSGITYCGFGTAVPAAQKWSVRAAGTNTSTSTSTSTSTGAQGRQDTHGPHGTGVKVPGAPYAVRQGTLCLASGAGGRVTMATCDGTQAQVWDADGVDTTLVPIRDTNGHCLTVSGQYISFHVLHFKTA